MNPRISQQEAKELRELVQGIALRRLDIGLAVTEEGYGRASARYAAAWASFDAYLSRWTKELVEGGGTGDEAREGKGVAAG